MSRRRGLTLLEVLLVLSLLVILAAVARPALDRPLANQQLRQAANAVRIEWTRARVAAMSSGLTYVFRLEPQTDRYQIDCREGAEFVAEEASGRETSASSIENTLPEVAAPAQHALPTGCRFLAGTNGGDAGDAPIPSEGSAARGDSAGFSETVLFHPDGTTADAIVVLANEQGRRIAVTLRGLTGVAKVGELLAPGEEVLPEEFAPHAAR